MQEGKVRKGQVVKEGFSGGWKEGWSWVRPWRKGPIWVSLRKCLHRGVQRETKGKHGWLDEKLEGKRPEELVGTLIALWEWDGRKVESWSQRVWGSAMKASCHCLAFGKNRLLREIPLPTLMTLELSPHQSLLWLTGSSLGSKHQPGPQDKLCLLKACFCSCPRVYAFGPVYRVHYLEVQGLAAALGLRQSFGQVFTVFRFSKYHCQR